MLGSEPDQGAEPGTAVSPAAAGLRSA